MAFERPKPNYTAEEYVELIGNCDSPEQLNDIDTLIREDKKCFDFYQYIDIRMAYTFRKISFGLEEAEDRLLK